LPRVCNADIGLYHAHISSASAPLLPHAPMYAFVPARASRAHGDHDVCKCGETVRILVVKNGRPENRGRKFQKCDGCKAFSWVDPVNEQPRAALWQSVEVDEVSLHSTSATAAAHGPRCQKPTLAFCGTGSAFELLGYSALGTGLMEGSLQVDSTPIRELRADYGDTRQKLYGRGGEQTPGIMPPFIPIFTKGARH
jgi:hypothetical protein